MSILEPAQHHSFLFAAIITTMTISCIEVTDDELEMRAAGEDVLPIDDHEPCVDDDDCDDCEFCDYYEEDPSCKPMKSGCDGKHICDNGAISETCAADEECCGDGAGGLQCVDDCSYCSGHIFYYNGGASSTDCCTGYGQTCREQSGPGWSSIGCSGSCTSNCTTELTGEELVDGELVDTACEVVSH